MTKSQKRFKAWQKNLLTIIIAFIIIIYIFKPMVFSGLRPGGVDKIANIGRNHQRKEYEAETGKTALWNLPVFSGMPMYHRVYGKAFNVDKIIGKKGLGKIVYMYVWIFLIGFIGMFYLLKEFRLNYWAAVFGALAFTLIPHCISLLNIGHFTKVRSIMYMPMIMFFFLSFLKKKNILWWLGFVFMFVIFIRAQHYQIIFYQILILFFITVYHFVIMFRNKERKKILNKLGFIIGAAILVTAMVAQPLFVTGEYTPYSIRGGTGEKGSTGLGFDYSTKWSMHPSEILTWFMPRFFGGTSQEKYTGNEVSQIKGRVIPGYWGHMPFTQTYDYIGAIIIFLGLIGLYFNFKKKNIIKVFTGIFILALFLSFGRHFPLIYNLFFKFIPYFNKFRVPAMIQVVIQIIFVIWAGFGVNSLINLYSHGTKEERKRAQKVVIRIAILMILIGLIPHLFGESFSLEKSGDAANYRPQVLKMIKTARLDMMKTDGLRLIIFVIITGLLTYLFLNKSLKKYLFISGLLILLLFDYIPYDKKSLSDLNDLEYLKNKRFAKTQVDKVLLQDESYYRIFPITENPFNTNDWSYYHNSIGGYSAAKLRIYQDIIENCLQKKSLHWNIFKMLNVKYLISRKKLPEHNLKLFFQDNKSKLNIYKTELNVKPAWFVEEYQVIKDREKRFEIINSNSFNPYVTALLEKEYNFNLGKTDSTKIVLDQVSFDNISYDIFVDKPSLMVISEVYYPEGWKCYVDGEQTKIYKTDHILRSVFINKPGKHNIEFKFEPETFILYYNVSLVAHIIAYLMLIGSIVVLIYKKRKK